MPAARRRRHRPGLHLHPADRDRDLRLQREPDARLAAAEPDHRLVLARRSTTSGARDAFVTSIKVGLVATAIALMLGTLASLAVARHRFFGRETISFLVDPADRAARDRHRRGALQHLHAGPRHRPQPVHGHHRARDLLHRRRLQQRDRPAAPARPARSRRPRPTSARTRGRPSATSPSRACARRWSPARCWPSRSPSTRSSSPRSRSAPASRRCRSGSSRTSSGPTSCRSSTSSR